MRDPLAFHDLFDHEHPDHESLARTMANGLPTMTNGVDPMTLSKEEMDAMLEGMKTYTEAVQVLIVKEVARVLREHIEAHPTDPDAALNGLTGALTVWAVGMVDVKAQLISFLAKIRGQA